MKLLLISTDSETNIDQIMVVVPDDYKAKEVLEIAQDHLDGDPSIEGEIDLGDEGKYPFSEFRIYVG
jgi:hypothetical protein